MRTPLIRLSAAAALLLALGACSDAGNGLPSGAGSNNSGGGVVNTNAGEGTVPANTIPPKLVDDGTVSKGKYTGFNTTATDTQSATEVPADAAAFPALPNPPSPNGATDGGSHSVAFSGNGLTQVTLAYGGTVPNLTYTYGQSGNSVSYNYSTIAFHATYAPGMTSPGTLSGVSLEFTGGSALTAYDVRVACTLPTAGLPATFTTAATSLVTCSGLPAYPIAGLLTTNPDTTGPNAVAPGSTGQFTPTASKLYVVLTYAGTTATAGTATIGIDDLYAKQ